MVWIDKPVVKFKLKTKIKERKKEKNEPSMVDISVMELWRSDLFLHQE